MLGKLIFLTGLAVWIIVILGAVDYIKKHNVKLSKTQNDRVFCGVCGGIGRFLGISSTLVRIIWVIVTICGGSGIIAYIIATILMPRDINDIDMYQ